MPSLTELTLKVTELAQGNWGHIPLARVLPEPDDLTFGNAGEFVDVCILYADIHRSTEMVDSLPPTLAASYYKAFLHCAAHLIKSNGGSIQAYDGDRVMGVFIGERKAESAVLAAFELRFAVQYLINPTFSQLEPRHRPIVHTVGIDQGQVLVAKTGVRRYNDLVWVGAPANYAAKLNSFEGLDTSWSTRITNDVLFALPLYLRVQNTALIWEGPYNDLKNKNHFRSFFHKVIV